MSKIINEGICRFCMQTFSGRSISRHLISCKAKKARDENSAASAKKTHDIFHLKLESYKPYWLHIEMKAAARLSELDDFLRRIWLECCGHLSEFTIDGMRYSDSGDDGWGPEPESLKTPLKNVLGAKSRFGYEYDFGSTTQVVGTVVALRNGVLSKPVEILARNSPPTYPCENCDAPATQFCCECETLICDNCLAQHECDEEMLLPVVNSPRFGVCGYCGESDTDDFLIRK
ncbi:hypothetical protein JXJ21_23975 [candidate division KSB1 bacterium]|nr:hypothetical protein [candidate division KSB1 bacterium]